MADAATVVSNKLLISSKLDRKILQKDVSSLVSLPKMVYVNKFDEASAKQFASDFADAEDSDQEIIPVVIDSFGGYVYALLSMVDMVQKSKKKVATIAMGKAMSCGAVLFSQGSEGHRYMSKFATLMIHDVSSSSWGKVEELKADVKESDRLNDMIYKLMDEGTGHDVGYFKKIVHDRGHADWFLTSDEAKEHNMANHIRVPKFNVEVKVDINFS